MLVVLSVLGAAGCTPFIVKDDVIGPHGERLISLQCDTPDQCMSFARDVCRGDFDVVTNNYAVGERDSMLVHCKNPQALPGVAVSVAPDAGAP
jgi:hypothetical protein